MNTSQLEKERKMHHCMCEYVETVTESEKRETAIKKESAGMIKNDK